MARRLALCHTSSVSVSIVRTSCILKVTVLAFLLELLRRNNDSDPALLTMPLPSLLHCLKLVNEPHGESPHTERHVHTVIIFVNNMPNKLAAMGVFSRFFVCAICVW